MIAISIPVLVLAGVTVYVGTTSLFMYFKRRDSRTDLTFALNCLAVAAYQIFTAGLYNSGTSAESLFWGKGQLASICLIATVFPWFIHDYLSLKPGRTVHALTLFFIACVFPVIFLDSPLMWQKGNLLIRDIILPMGIRVTYTEAKPGIFSQIIFAAGFFMLFYVLAVSIINYRKSGNKRAKLLILSVAVFFTAAVNDILVTFGSDHFIYIAEYSYLGFVILMARSLNQEILEAARLRKNLIQNEESFRDIVEITPFPIAIIGKDESFEYLNRKFIEEFGYTTEDLATTDDWFRIAYPDPEYRARVIDSWRYGGISSEKKIIGTREFAVTTSDGSVRQMMISVLAVTEGRRFVVFNDITEQKKIERDLRKNEEWYRLIYDNASEIIFSLDKNMVITYISLYSQRILGYRPDDLIGRPLFDVKIIAEDSVPHLLNTIMRIIGGETITSTVYKFINNRGSIRYGEISGSPLVRKGEIIGMVGFARDITERKLAEDTIMKRDRILNAVSKAANILLRSRNLDNAVLEVLSTLGKVTQMSRIIIYKNIPGEDGEPMICKRFHWVHQTHGTSPPNDMDGTSYERIAHWKSLLSREVIIHGITDDFPDAERSIMESQGILSTVLVPMFVSDQWWGFVEFDDCETPRDWNPIEIEVLKLAASIIGSSLERKRSEEELLKTSKIESLGVFAGGIAHDFNNLLTSVIGNMSLARMYLPEDTESRRILEEAEQAAQRTRELTQQLLTFSRGGMPIKKTASIRHILTETAQFVMSGTNFNREFTIPEDLWNVRIDPGQISQVIHNILLNARQSMKDRGVIAISAENVELEDSDQLPLPPGKYVKITVRDQGEGITKKNLRNIFDPYFTTKKDGSGLGLSISYSIIKKHDGHISAHSEIGKGSVFDIYLPASGEQTTPEIDQEPLPPLPGGRALVMDDEDTVLKVITRMLERNGFSVTCVKNGAEAISAYEGSVSEGSPYDVVIMDLTIPGGVGGKEANAILQKKYPGTRVIVSSGYSNDPVMAEFASHGFSGVIVKPYRYEELTETLRRVMLL